MRTKKIAVALACATVLASPLALADRDRAQGRVLEVKPIYETVRVSRPEEHCWDERVADRGPSEATGTIAGAVVGGVVGNQFGKGSGRDAATVAGALLGGAIGNDMSRQHDDGYRVVRRCETRERHTEREEVVAYRVKYEYRGKVDWTRTREHPGKFIDLDVDVRPARHQ